MMWRIEENEEPCTPLCLQYYRKVRAPSVGEKIRHNTLKEKKWTLGVLESTLDTRPHVLRKAVGIW